MGALVTCSSSNPSPEQRFDRLFGYPTDMRVLELGVQWLLTPWPQEAAWEILALAGCGGSVWQKRFVAHAAWVAHNSMHGMPYGSGVFSRESNQYLP